MKNSEICILILSTIAPQYQGFIDVIKNTWLKDASSIGIQIFFYSGNYTEDCIYSEYEIRVKEGDETNNSYKKFIAAKNVLFNNYPEIQVIFRTNLSSYIDIGNFCNYVKNSNFNTYSYDGIPGTAFFLSEFFYRLKFLHVLFKYLHIGPRINFFSGSGFFIGRDLVQKLSYNKFYNYLIDDVEIGRQIKIFNRNKNIYKRVYILDQFFKIERIHYDELINKYFLFHYKFKSSNRNFDIQLMNNFSDSVYRRNYLTK